MLQTHRMDIPHLYAAFTQSIVNLTGMSRAMLHVHAGMGIYLAAQCLLRDRRASIWALLAVVQMEFFNEIMNRLAKGAWDWPDTVADIALTLFWPSLSYATGTWRRQRWAVRHAAVRPQGQGPLLSEEQRMRNLRPAPHVDHR